MNAHRQVWQTDMNHFQPFFSRNVLILPTVERSGWRLKRYAVLSNGKEFDQKVISAALDSAIERLPKAGGLDDENGNHGVSFQIIHFAEVAVVSPVFYWQWGSVLANIQQMRAPWENSTKFDTGVKEVVGCIWEMQIVCFEIQAWTNTLLNNIGTPHDKLADYLERHLSSATPLVNLPN